MPEVTIAKGSASLERYATEEIPMEYEVTKDNSSESESVEEETGKRFVWTSRKEQLVIAIAYTAGLDNLYLFINFGQSRRSGNNVVQLLIIFTIFALPLLYTEIFLGQYTQLGCLHLGKCSPVAHGIGVAMLCIATFQTVIESTDFCNCLIYLVFCCSSELPWLSCGRDPKDAGCLDNVILKACHSSGDCDFSAERQFSTDIYFRKTVLQTSTKTGIGSIVWRRAAFMICVWMIPYYPALRGLSWIRHVMQVLLVMIVIIMIILFAWVGVHPGTSVGLMAMFNIDMSSLISMKAWANAVQFSFLRLHVTQAGHILFGSYMTDDFHSDIDAIIVCIVNIMGTFFGATFSHVVAGVMSNITGMNIQTMPLGDDGITFTMIPQLLGVLPIPHLFTASFFIVCCFLSVGNQAIQVNVTCETIIEAIPKARVHRNYIVLIICGVSFLLSLFFLTTTDKNVMNIISDELINMSAGIILLVETIAIMYIYGVQRFSDDIHFMLGFQPTLFWKITWMAMPPFLAMFLLSKMMSGIYNKANKSSLSTLFIIVFVTNLGPIVIGASYKLFQYLKNHNLVGFVNPEEDWGPRDPIERKLRSIFNPRQEIRSRRRIDICQHHCIINSIALEQAISLEELSSHKVGIQEQMGTLESDNTLYD